MHNEIITIGKVTIYGYGLMIGIGILCAYLLTEYRAKKQKLDNEPIFNIAIIAVVFGFLSAKLLYIITVFDKILSGQWGHINIRDGFVVYGGIIGGIISVLIYCRIKKLHFLTYMDLVIPAVSLAQGFGRIGCFLAGCCYGMETQSWFSITFTHSHYAPNNVPLFPSQLVSSAFDFALAALLCFIAKKELLNDSEIGDVPSKGPVSKAPGTIGALYLTLYSVGRFIIEFFRGDIERGSVGTLSTSQFISIFTFAAGILMFVFIRKQNKAIK